MGDALIMQMVLRNLLVDSRAFEIGNFLMILWHFMVDFITFYALLG